MMVADLLKHIDAGLQLAEDRLGRDEPASVADLIQVRQWLGQAERESEVGAEVRVAELRRRYDRIAGPLADAALQTCERQLRELAAANSVDEALLTQARQRLNAILQLYPERRRDDALIRLQEQAELLALLHTSTQRLEQLREEIKSLWSQAATLEQHNPDLALDYCKQALDRAESALSARASWQVRDRDQVEILRSQARQAYDDLRFRHEVTTTKQGVGPLVEIILDFAARAKRDPAQLVTYFSEDGSSSNLVMEVARALDIARGRLIAAWGDKVGQYIRAADDRLKSHRPTEAVVALKDWESLPGLYDARLGVVWQRNLEARITEAEKRIKPELEAYERADEYLKAVQTQIQVDVVRAYQSWKDAREAYLYHPDLEATQSRLLEKARAEAQALFAEFETALHKEVWTTCERTVTRLDGLLALDESLAQPLQDCYPLQREIYLKVRAIPASGKTHEQLALLNELPQAYPDYWQGWPGLQQRLSKLTVRRNLNDLKSQADQLCTVNGVLEPLEALKAECVGLREDAPEGLTDEDDRELKRIVERLEAWIGFATARDELERISAADSDGGGDLKIIEDGIAAVRARARVHGAAQAVRERRLEEQLRRLKQNDVKALETKKSIEVQLRDRELPLDTLHRALELVNEWLGQPTSYRTDFMGLRRRVQAELLKAIDGEVRRLIAEARARDYTALDARRAKELLKEFAGLQRGAQLLTTAESLEGLAAGPLKVAETHKLEESARQGKVSWETVRRDWELAVDHFKNDVSMHEFCTQRVTLAYKQGELSRLQQMPPAEAFRGVQMLCDDKLLREDWEIWFYKGRYGLQAAQALLQAGAPEPAGIGNASDYLSVAREALNRADQLARTQSVRAEGGRKIQATLAELDRWDFFARARLEITRALEIGNERLTSGASTKAREAYERAKTALAGGSPFSLLDKLWSDQCAQVRRATESRPATMSNLLDWVDELYALSVLYPQDRIYKTKLAQRVNDAVTRAVQDTRETVSDYEAQSFLRRYENLHRSRHPDEAKIVGLQIEDAAELRSRIQTLRRITASLVNQPEAEVGEVQQLSGDLEEAERAVEEWAAEVQDLQHAVSQAFGRAEEALHSSPKVKSSGFDQARYILHRGPRATYKDYRQVLVAFRAHPTVMWCGRRVEELEQHRAKQERLARDIRVCLQYAEHPNELPPPGPNDDTEEGRLIKELRDKLTAAVRRQYPLEVAFERIHEMRSHDEKDECFLQQDQEWYDPLTQKTYKSLTAIEAVVERRVKQFHRLYIWFGQFKREGEVVPAGYECPGIVSWKKRKRQIERQRDMSLEGMMWGQRMCKAIRLGEGSTGLVDELWALTTAQKALTPDSMMRQLQPREPGESQVDEGLSALACAVDRERQELLRELEEEIADCVATQQDIAWRIEHFDENWRHFEVAYSEVLRARRPNTDQLRNFQQATDEFYKICPHYQPFQDALEEVFRRKGVDTGRREMQELIL